MKFSIFTGEKIGQVFIMSSANTPPGKHVYGKYTLLTPLYILTDKRNPTLFHVL